MARPLPAIAAPGGILPDLRDVKGQETAKRALEIAAAGGHNLLMQGSPVPASRCSRAACPRSCRHSRQRNWLEVSMIHSVAGLIDQGRLTDRRPFRAPHHSASMAALTGGGLQVKPGEVSLAHHGVLFLDELPEFQPQVLDSLRQPLELGEGRGQPRQCPHRLSRRFQLIAAMNPAAADGARNGYAASARRTRNAWAQYQMRACPARCSTASIFRSIVPPVSASAIMPTLAGSAEGSAGGAPAGQCRTGTEAARASAIGAPEGTTNARLRRRA